MKKQTLFIMLALMFTTGSARELTLNQAVGAAQEFRAQNARAKGFNRRSMMPELAFVQTNAQSMKVDYYVFNFGADEGYVVVSGDDRTLPVLAYSEKGNFDPKRVPCGLAWLLNKYRHEIEWARAHPEASSRAETAAPSNSDVAPLLSTHWQQHSPYNDFCPYYTGNNGRPKHCAAGCLAIAMGQIMNYHRWPDHPRGAHRYTCYINDEPTPTNFVVDFSGYTVPWDNMLDTYQGTASTEQQRKDIAEFISRVGRSIDMAYGSTSYAYDYVVANALHQYFVYNPRMAYLRKGDYSTDAWQRMIVEELKAGRPVYYSGRDYNHDGKEAVSAAASDDGSSQGIGHAFVIDGFHVAQNATTGCYFHINWGWGEGYDNYCLLWALDVADYHWSNKEYALLGIRPALPDDYPMAVGTAILSHTRATVPSGSTASFSFSNASVRGIEAANGSTMKWGIAVCNAGDAVVSDEISWLECGYNSSYPRYFAYNFHGTAEARLGYEDKVFGVSKEVELPDGQYHVWLAWSSDGGQSINRSLRLLSEKDYIPMVVKHGMASFNKELPVPITCCEETFDNMSFVDAETPTVRSGDIGKWELLKCQPAAFAEGNVAVEMATPSKMEMQDPIVSEGVTQITIDAYNKASLPAKFDLRYSVDGAQWVTCGEVKAIESGERTRLVYNVENIGPGPVRFSLSMIAGKSCLIDNVRIYAIGAEQPGITGDLDHNGVVDIDDINQLINIIVHKAAMTTSADFNNDGFVDVDDMNVIINKMLRKG